MTKQKGITPIIAILVMLLITIAITGSAWIYINTYYSTLTETAGEITSTDCTSAGVKIYFRNIGTGVMTVGDGDDVDVTDRINVSGDCATDADLTTETYSDPNVDIGGSGIATDPGCTSGNDGTLRYTIVVGGRALKATVTC